MSEDITTASLGTGSNGKPVYLKDIWPTNDEIADAVKSSIERDQFIRRYGDVFEGTAEWKGIKISGDAETYGWVDGSTYVKNPPYFEGITMEPAPKGDINGGPRARAVRRQHHHRPHQPRRATSRRLRRPVNISASGRWRSATSTATAPGAATTRS